MLALLKRSRLYPDRNKTIKILCCMLHSTTVMAFLLEFTEEVGFYHINRWYYCPINRRFISFSLLSIAALDPAAHHCTPTITHHCTHHCIHSTHHGAIVCLTPCNFFTVESQATFGVTGTPLDVVSFLFCPLLQNCTHTFDGT